MGAYHLEGAALDRGGRDVDGDVDGDLDDPLDRGLW